ncbi:MAG: IS607 family transposase [Clostridia bacterium]|jgi:predicted site-specific integrase-resolvase
MKKKISTYAKEHNISYRTVWNMVKSNKLAYEKLPTGTILILDSENKSNSDIRVSLYARVSSSENKVNLDKQLERLENFAIAKGWKIVHSVKEVGSGLNDKRIQLEKLLSKRDYDIILVEHKDRFSRFGVNYIENLLNQTNRKLYIINDRQDNTPEDLMQDFVSIVTSFTARLYGLRRSKRKTEKLIEELKNEN